jgi:hypothetical protein
MMRLGTFFLCKIWLKIFSSFFNYFVFLNLPNSSNHPIYQAHTPPTHSNTKIHQPTKKPKKSLKKNTVKKTPYKIKKKNQSTLQASIHHIVANPFENFFLSRAPRRNPIEAEHFRLFFGIEHNRVLAHIVNSRADLATLLNLSLRQWPDSHAHLDVVSLTFPVFHFLYNFLRVILYCFLAFLLFCFMFF